MKVKKKIVYLLVACMVMITSAISVYAVSGSYSTYYDMKGGVYSQRTWDATAAPRFDIGVSQAYSSEYLYNKLNCYLEKKVPWGWGNADSDQVPVATGGYMLLRGNESGTYRLYFRLEATGYRASGGLNIEWSW